ncbi:MAG: hypothetical protein Roseis2KO_07520 [Roseivirga sp.]
MKVASGRYKVSQILLFVVLFLPYGCENKDSLGFEFASPYIIEVIGQDYEWRIRYPGKDGIINTLDDILKEDNFVLPANTEIRLIFKSEDYLYFVELPELKKNGMAVPGLESPLNLKTTSPMKIQFKGDQMCGFSHESLIKSVVVQDKKDFVAYLTD